MTDHSLQTCFINGTRWEATCHAGCVSSGRQDTRGTAIQAVGEWIDKHPRSIEVVYPIDRVAALRGFTG